jgi:G8 domain
VRSLQLRALVLTIAVIAVMSPAVSRAAAVGCGQAGYTPLSSVSACLGVGSSCTINSKVYVDKSITRVGGQPLGSLTIAAGGELAFPNTSTRVEVANIIVDGGELQIGSKACPIDGGNLDELDFYGSNPVTQACGTAAFDKGICFVKGKVSIVGAKGVKTQTHPGVTWTHLRCPAGPSDIYGGGGLAAPVQGAQGVCPGDKETLAIQGKVDWAQNDWIVLSGTGFADDQAEFVQIGAITPGVNNTVITLSPTTTLLHYHFGSASPNSATGKCIAGDGKTVEPASFCAGAALNYGVDERAEVGLISRNVLLSGRQAWEANATYEAGATILATVSNQVYQFQTAAGGLSGATIPTFPSATSGTVADNTVTWTNMGSTGTADASGDLHWGGEIKMLAGAAAAKSITIEGAEMEEFGKDQLGSYPIHFHMTGTVPPWPVAVRSSPTTVSIIATTSASRCT